MTIMLVHESNGDFVAAKWVHDTLPEGDVDFIRSINDLAEYFCQTVTFVKVEGLLIRRPEVEQFIRNLNGGEVEQAE